MMNRRIPLRRSAVITLAGLAATLVFTSAPAAPSGQAAVLGRSYGEWSAQWWQWLTAIPAATNPILQSGAVDCSRGQRGPVVFLAGTLGSGPVVRSCTIPEKAIFFPLVNLIVFNTPPPDPQFSVAEKREAADFTMSLGCNLSAEIDGVPTVYSLVTARTQSPTFSSLAGPDDLFGRPAGSLDPETISDGFWIMLPPLSPGAHTLTFTGALCTPPGTPIFEVDVTYHLTVE